jgi:hypothetical protein
MTWHPRLNRDEWVIRPLTLSDKFHGWFVANKTYWGKTVVDEDTGKEYCSGWDSYYLHKNGEIEIYSDYFETKELAEQALNNYLEKEKHEASSTL